MVVLWVQGYSEHGRPCRAGTAVGSPVRVTSLTASNLLAVVSTPGMRGMKETVRSSPTSLELSLS
ncbi:protein of unknown function [Blastococcus saxobsidens DD2]|uniref:Uncharacterized protein n=1 Tax=Blastococcus saxobsidens (strain DD2) TaxID=1146883 RepID=H6RS71_BLASD|nr:protein of unknown function [Blastococcus saxobsidens DD2]